MTCSQFMGEYSDLQVPRVTVNTGTGHAVSRGTTFKGRCCSSKECCGGREQRILCRKNVACYKVSESASENDGFLKKFHKGWGGGSRESTFSNTNWSTSLSLCLWRNAAPHFKWFNQYQTGVYKEQDRSYRLQSQYTPATALHIHTNTETCSKPPTRFGLFRLSSGRHATKKTKVMSIYATDVQW